jgi:hypothetical protein
LLRASGGPHERGNGRLDPTAAARHCAWGRWLLAGLVVLGGTFAGGWGIAVFKLFPPPPPAGDVVRVPAVVGRSLADAERSLHDAGLMLESQQWIPGRTESPGVVLAQSPLPGQLLRPGAGVRLSVSGGRPRAVLPDLLGLPLAGAQGTLRRAGFDVDVIEEYSLLPAGRVLGIEPPPGTEHELPASILLYVSTRVLPGTEEDSLDMLADSLAAAVDNEDTAGRTPEPRDPELAPAPSPSTPLPEAQPPASVPAGDPADRPTGPSALGPRGGYGPAVAAHSSSPQPAHTIWSARIDVWAG